ncbi:MAG: hypothetical protein HZA36_00815 [Parcubacteria group bacterium]|nr:hypothetical protein [Parcubacteria group bacterium]
MISFIRKLLSFESERVHASAVIVGIGVFINGILSLLRNTLLASFFGASHDLDVYFAAFRIPDLIFVLIITGALSSIFIPHFSKYLNESREKAWDFTTKIINGYLLFGSLLACILFWQMPILMHYLVPGFGSEKTTLAIYLARLLLIQPILLGVSSIISGALQSFGKFFITSYTPILYNLSIILGIVVLSPRFGIEGVVFGVLMGACLHLFLQALVLIWSGFRHKLRLLSLKEAIDIARLVLPRFINVLLVQANIILTLRFLSHLDTGSITIFNLAFDIYTYPINLIVTSIITASYPVLARYFNTSSKEFIRLFLHTFRAILISSSALFLLFAFFATPIVRYILQHGALTQESTQKIAQILFFLSIGIVANSLLPYLIRISFIVQNTTLPLLASILNTSIYFFLGPILLARYGINGIALALSLAIWCDVILLSALILHKLKRLCPVVKSRQNT